MAMVKNGEEEVIQVLMMVSKKINK